MPVEDASKNTQPIQQNTEDFTQPMTVDSPPSVDEAIQNSPLPAWILDWAANENLPTRSRDVLLAELEEAEPFEAPELDESISWGSEPSHLTPMAELENCLHAKDFSGILILVQNHKTDPSFRLEAGKAIRKHLNLDDMANPLWEANEILNNEPTGDE